jgi:hypothetical protein
MNGRTSRATILVVALALGHTAVINLVAQAAPADSTSIRAVQNSTGATAIIIITSKKYAKDSIVVTSSLLQGKSTPKTSIIGSVSVGKDGTAVITSAKPLPEKSTLSVFSGSNHLITVVDIPIPTVTNLPKPSKVVASTKSVTKKILQAAAYRWRIEFDKSREQIIAKDPVNPTALRDAVDSAVAALNAYANAGGDIKNQLAVSLESAINARPQVIADIMSAADAVREATTRLPAALNPVAQPVDSVALREAGDFALKSLDAYLAAGGSNQDELVVSLLNAMKVFPPVIADITAAANAIRVATNQLPPPVDPRRAAEEEVLRGLVVKAEALIESYFAAGGTGEDEVALALLGALNAEPQNLLNIIEAMNALSFARTQLPTPENLEVLFGG